VREEAKGVREEAKGVREEAKGVREEAKGVREEATNVLSAGRGNQCTQVREEATNVLKWQKRLTCNVRVMFPFGESSMSISVKEIGGSVFPGGTLVLFGSSKHVGSSPSSFCLNCM
jgi:hypothetical protein